RCPPSPTRLPYTTLFRSLDRAEHPQRFTVDDTIARRDGVGEQLPPEHERPTSDSEVRQRLDVLEPQHPVDRVAFTVQRERALDRVERPAVRTLLVPPPPGLAEEAHRFVGD